MLDVHVPEHPVHGVRDFFLHLFTITVGLLIALGLEGAVEHFHHEHLAHQAQENIRRELQSNREEVSRTLSAIPREQQDMKQIVQFLQARIDNKPLPVHTVTVSVTEANPHDASWRTASATAALNYMEFDRVQRMSAAYQIQDKFQRLEDGAEPHAIALIAALGTGDPTTMSAADAAITQRDARLLMAHLEAVRELGEALEKSYDEVLHD